MKRQPHNKILKKIFLSYFLLLLIPILLFSIFSAYFNDRYITENIRGQQTLTAEKTLYNISGELGNIRKISDEMLNNKLFYLEFAKLIAAPFYDIRDYLSKAEGMLNDNIKIYYCNLSDNEVHSSEGVYKTNSPIDDILSGSTYIMTRKIIKNKQNIVYFVPIEFTKNKTVKSAAVFVADNSYFENALDFSSAYNNVMSEITVDNISLYTVNPAEDYSDTSKYMRISSENSQGYRIDSYIPMSEIRKNSFYPTLSLLIFAFLMSLVCVVIVGITLKKIYVPWQKSIVRLQKLSGAPCETPKQIDDNISSLIAANETLNAENIRLKNEYALSVALAQSTNIASARLEQVKTFLPGPMYLCMTGEAELNTSFADEENIPHSVLKTDQKTVSVVFSSGRNVLKDLIDRMSSGKTPYTGAPVGIGTISDTASLLHKSYINSKIAFNRAQKSNSSIVVYEDGDSQSQYPFDVFDELDGALSRRDTDEIKQLTEKLKTFILTKSNRSVACCIFQEYLKTVSCGLSALKKSGFDAVAMRNLYYKNLSVSAEALADNITAVMAVCEQQMTELAVPEKAVVTAAQIEEYIKANYLNPNFSLKTMSFDLQISPSNASHIFKKEKDVTLSEYVDDLKIEYSKELLGKSGSINEVSAALGFATPSGFIKKFKAIVGCTPGAYKEGINKPL